MVVLLPFLFGLKAPDEFYVDKTTSTLYLYYNSTTPNTPPSASQTDFVVPYLKTLVHFKGGGVGP